MAYVIRSFQTTVTTAGVAVQLTSSNITAKWVRISAICALSTSKMYIGNTGANTVSATTGNAIVANDSVVYCGIDSSGHSEPLSLSSIYVDADVSLDKVSVSYAIETD